MGHQEIHAAPSPFLDRPRLLAFGGVVLGAGAAWIALGSLHGPDAGLSGPVAHGHGAAIAHGDTLPAAITIWVLMSVAMMLPTAAPAIDIYVRLSRRIEVRRAAHVAGFAGGYLAAWSGFSVLAAGAQIALASVIAAGTGDFPPGILAGALLLLAGLYQFTPLKQACLTQCRNPLAFFMSHWRDGVGGSAWMGLRHGAICIGCCWALMGLMFLFGAANLVWMAALGLVMLLEKTAPGAVRAGRVTGLVMALAGAALIVTNFI
jgi:predicted metal-binding membrane protein